MRGGTSKGVFFNISDLPKEAQVAGPIRDKLILRVLGSPDPYGKQIDGMGGATSSTSKVVILSKSNQPNHDLSYLFGQVSIDKPLVDWSGNCGNLTAAVGSFAITNGIVDKRLVPKNGVATVRIWQENIRKTIIAYIPILNGLVQETGAFELDGVTFPAAEVSIEFIKPVDSSELMFPTGKLIDILDVPDVGNFKVTMINAGIPTIFVNAKDLGYNGAESQEVINTDLKALARLERIRAYGAVHMGLIQNLTDAENRQHTPKLVLIAESRSYTSSSGKGIDAQKIDINARALSMGKLHHAMMGTVAVAIGAAASIPGTLVNLTAGGKERTTITFGHPSGTLKVGAETVKNGEAWLVNKVIMSRSARTLMEGCVLIPNVILE